MAKRLDQATNELESAARHARVAAEHFRDGEVPRGCAHAWAAHGHCLSAQALLNENAQLRAAHAQA